MSWTPSGPLTAPPRSILIVMMSAVGDAVQVLPVASALRRTFPSSHITWALQPGPLSLVQGHPAIDEFVPVERKSRERGLPALVSGFREILRASRSLRTMADQRHGGKFDLLLDFQVYFKAGILTAITPADIKVGFDRSRARDLNWVFTTHKIPPLPTRFGHIQDQYFEFLRFIGVDPEPLAYGLELSEFEATAQREFFSSLSRPACAMVVATSNPRKDWSPERYAEMASEFHGTLGVQPILVGGRSPREERMAREIIEKAGPGIIDARGGGLRRLLWLLDGSDLVVSPDTGPLHMATAMGVPVVGLYGFTNPKRSGPYRRFAELVVDGYARFPGEDYGVSMDRRPGGMARVTTDAALKKAKSALGIENS